MNSFHHSRVRVSLEAICALGIAASLVAAAQQTYAPALFGGAAFAGLFGLMRAFDLVRQAPAAGAVDVQPAADRVEIIPMAEFLSSDVEEAVPAEPAPRQAKAPRKPRARRAAKQPKAAELSPAQAIAEAATADEPEADAAPTDENVTALPLAPLFEPEPFVRQQQRAVFGCKAG